MKRVYVAGAMSSSDPIQFLENLRKGMRLSTETLLAGYSIFSPFIDYSYFFQLHGGERISIELIQSQSMAWLAVSEAVLLVPGWESSKGTAHEIAFANRHEIPIFQSLEELKQEMPTTMGTSWWQNLPGHLKRTEAERPLI